MSELGEGFPQDEAPERENAEEKLRMLLEQEPAGSATVRAVGEFASFELAKATFDLVTDPSNMDATDADRLLAASELALASSKLQEGKLGVDASDYQKGFFIGLDVLQLYRQRIRTEEPSHTSRRDKPWRILGKNRAVSRSTDGPLARKVDNQIIARTFLSDVHQLNLEKSRREKQQPQP